MTTSFDRWEKDPFFSAAEEVQESADRMESTYRTWMHAKKDASSMWDPEELERDLQTTLGTTKWQLEVFERAVSSSYHKAMKDDSKDRHREFVVAIEDNIFKVDSSLKESSFSDGKRTSPWMRLDEGECNELALFLSGHSPSSGLDKSCHAENDDRLEMGNVSILDCSKNLDHSVDKADLETKEEKTHGHRRVASASADISAWKIAMAEEVCPLNSSDGQTPSPRPTRRVPSLSGILSCMETAPKFIWPKSAVRKLKAMYSHQESDVEPLRASQLTRQGIDVCYEKSQSCLDGSDECNKQLYGWYGAIQRQLQRSQYRMQYSRPIQAALSTAFLFCLVVLVALRAL